MANFVFNIAKGKVKQYFDNVDTGSPANSRIIVVPLLAAGLEADATLADYDNLSLLLAASNDEQTAMGRKTLTGADITTTVNDTNNRAEITLTGNITWTAATGGAVGALVFCYDNDNTSGTDTDLIPLLKYDFSVTPDGSDIIAQVNANGLWRSTDVIST